MSRLLNLLALGFTIIFSAFLLLFVKWSAFQSECIREDTCDISQVSAIQAVSASGIESHTPCNLLCITILVGMPDACLDCNTSFRHLLNMPSCLSSEVLRVFYVRAVAAWLDETSARILLLPVGRTTEAS